MKKLKSVLAILLAVALFVSVTACGGTAPQGSGKTVPEGSSSAETQNTSLTVTSFLPDLDYNGKVTNEEEAAELLYSKLNEIGGDENTEFVFHDSVSNDEDTVFYSFEQALGGLQIIGADAKVIVDKDGKPLAINSTVVSGLKPAPEDAWEITQEEAEAIVKKDALESGSRLLPNLTEQTILTLTGSVNARYVWVVYSTNVNPEVDRGYVANYVSGAGEYLYSVPVTEPGNSEALSGSVSVFAFEGYDEDTWTGTVTDIDGPQREITVPLLVDKENGKYALGDKERQIICADYADYYYNDTLTPITSEDGTTWNNNELITYEMLIRIWDFYASIGWPGMDGDGTPILLLLNVVDANGEPQDVADYYGLSNGFQVMAVNDEYGDGSCSDIIGHEYTHGVTSTALIFSQYMNDPGAINEGLSDIMGNLIEMMFGDSPGGEWLFSDRQANGTIRNMKDPHQFQQPEFVWDKYYVPAVSSDAWFNDHGGVHTNSSLLNLISYKLDQAGMKPEDQFYFWLNVILSLTTTTDYALMAKLLPWVLEKAGYSEFSDALNKAIEEGRLAETSVPEKPADGYGMITLSVPFDAEQLEVDAVVLANAVDNLNDQILTWRIGETPNVAMTLNPGDYEVRIRILDPQDEDAKAVNCVYTNEGWKEIDLNFQELFSGANEEEKEPYKTHLDEGQILNLETSSLNELLSTLTK